MSQIQTPATNRIFNFNIHQKTYLNKVVLSTCRQSKPQRRPIAIPVLPQHLDCCMFLQISKSPEEDFHRVISEENPAENENEGRYSKPQRIVCDIDLCVI